MSSKLLPIQESTTGATQSASIRNSRGVCNRCENRFALSAGRNRRFHRRRVDAFIKKSAMAFAMPARIKTFRLSAARFFVEALGKRFERLRDFFAETHGSGNGFSEGRTRRSICQVARINILQHLAQTAC